MKTGWLTVKVILILLPAISIAQDNTIYYDYSGKRTTDKKEAIDYMVYHPENDHFIGKKYTVRDNLLESIGDYSSIDPIVQDGHFVIYENAYITGEGDYVHNRKHGKWIYYRSEKKDKWYAETYISDDKIKLRSYYPTGRLKRKEKHNETYTKASGKCYGEKKHKKIPFTRFYTAPVPAYPMEQYLSENLKYPAGARDSSIEGAVVLKYVVNEDGNVTQTEVVKGIAGGCNQEAIRVLSNMPKWSPAIKDDKKTKVTFYQLVNFHFE